MKEALNELFTNNAVLRRKEIELNTLRNNLQLLNSENSQLKEQVLKARNRNNRQQIKIQEFEKANKTLKQKISNLAIELAKTNIDNQRIEGELAESLNEIGKLRLVIRAKERAITDLILKYERKRNYYGFNMGFGADYSGIGGSFFSRWGRLQGIGLHAGVGYLPLPDLLYQTSGWYTNIGCNFFIYKDLYVDATFHYPLKHVSGYKYDNALTFSLGYNWFPDFARPFGAKIAIGDLYTNTEQFGVEHSPIATLGITAKFSH